MPAPSVSSCNTSHIDSDAPAVLKSVTVTASLCIPALTHIQHFHPSTSMNEMNMACLTALSTTYQSMFMLNDPLQIVDLEVLSDLEDTLEESKCFEHVRLSDLRFQTSMPSQIFVNYTVSPDQNEALRHLVPACKDTISSLSTEALLLYERSKVNDENTSETRASGRKRRKSNASRNRSSSPVRPNSPVLEEEGSELSIDALQLENTTLKAERVCLQKNVEIYEAKIKALEREVRDLTGANKTLSDTLGMHIAKLHALHRRVLLDRAREKLLERYPIAERMNGAELAEALICRRATEGHGYLPDKAVRMVCAGTLRADGNVAAHHASFDDLSQSALDASLIQSERETLKSIFVYALGQEPVLAS